MAVTGLRGKTRERRGGKKGAGAGAGSLLRWKTKREQKQKIPDVSEVEEGGRCCATVRWCRPSGTGILAGAKAALLPTHLHIILPFLSASFFISTSFRLPTAGVQVVGCERG